MLIIAMVFIENMGWMEMAVRALNHYSARSGATSFLEAFQALRR